MPNLTADRVKETTTTTGTGTITLAGAVAQFRSFASAFADGSVVQYAIVGQTGTEWEVGNGTFTASGTTLARTTVLASSNSGSAVNFSAGTKDVFATVTAAHLLAAVLGPASATDNAVVVFDSTTGKLVKVSVLTVAPTSGALSTGDGTSSAPAYGFTSDPNTGVYLAGADTLSLTAGGVDAIYVLSNAISSNVDIRTYGDLRVGVSKGLFWSDVNNPNNSKNSGLDQAAAGVLKVTDGGAGIRALQGGGAAVASASALPVPTGRVFHVTGTTNITSITSTNLQAGVVITMIFDGVLTVTDGGNLKLAGNFVTAADSTLSLVYDGTNWYETGRSTN